MFRAWSLAVVASENDQVESITKLVDVVSFKLDPVCARALGWLVNPIGIFDNYPLFLPCQSSVFKKSDHLLRIGAQITKHRSYKILFEADYLLQKYFPLFKRNLHKLLLWLAIHFEKQNIKNLKAQLKLRVLIGDIVEFLVGNRLVFAEWCWLLELIVPDNDLAI